MGITYQGKIPTQNHNVSQQSLITKSFQIIFSLFAFIIFFSLAIYFSLGIFISYAPINFGRTLGETLLKTFEADTLKTKYPQQEQIEAIFNKLKEASPELESLDLRIINNPDFKNAFALPGGIIIIGTGLIKELRSEQEIAMILGHEIGHQVNRDALRRLSKGVIFMLFYSSLAISGGEVPVASSLNNLLDLSFSRKQELNADEYGLGLLQQAYKSPSGAVEAFESILKIEQDSKVNNYLDLSFLKTHPDTNYRIKKLKEMVKE